MTMFKNANSKHRPLQRRRKATLVNWWNALNRWDWPKQVQELTGIVEPVQTRDSIDERQKIMREIEQELGFREILKF